MSKKEYCSFKQIITICEILTKQLEDYQFDWIVTITRGGLVPACLVAQLLNIKSISVINATHYKGEERQNDLKIYPEWIKPKGNVLLIDDICDTGITLSEVYNKLKNDDINITTAVLHYKPKMSKHFTPDHWGKTTDAWVVYPWEVGEE